MTSMWSRVCELCGAVAAPDAAEGWLHQDTGAFLQAVSIDVCKSCCATKTVGELRDRLSKRSPLTHGTEGMG